MLYRAAFVRLLVALVVVGGGNACLPRPPDTPLHVRPTDGLPRSPARAQGALYSYLELREGATERRRLSLTEGSKLVFTAGIAARYGEPQVDSLPDPTGSAFGLAPWIRTVLARQGLDVARGVVPLSGALQLEGNRLDSLRGDLVLHLDRLHFDRQREAAGWADDLRAELFGLPGSGSADRQVRLGKVRLGSGPRPGFEVRGDASFELIGTSFTPFNVFMVLKRKDWQRYHWSSYQPIALNISEDFPDRQAAERLAELWGVRKIADRVNIQIELELEEALSPEL
ncbi:MAG: hypothetical protein CMP23_07185 [Rickettsiales bacterium]|nr:hypothetical protein [Rickettsiales bacterium]|tara:strand:+ start:3589 stop:4440 length:852 start_codon:yes stop_codon:yes gene_type:complete